MLNLTKIKVSKITIFLSVIALVLLFSRFFIFKGDQNSSLELIVQELKQIREEIQVRRKQMKSTDDLENREYYLIDGVLTFVKKNETKEKDILKWFGEPKLKVDAASDIKHIDGWSIYILTRLDPIPNSNQVIYGYIFYYQPEEKYFLGVDRMLLFVIDKRTKAVVNFFIGPHGGEYDRYEYVK